MSGGVLVPGEHQCWPGTGAPLTVFRLSLPATRITCAGGCWPRAWFAAACVAQLFARIRGHARDTVPGDSDRWQQPADARTLCSAQLSRPVGNGLEAIRATSPQQRSRCCRGLRDNGGTPSLACRALAWTASAAWRPLRASTSPPGDSINAQPQRVSLHRTQVHSRQAPRQPAVTLRSGTPVRTRPQKADLVRLACMPEHLSSNAPNSNTTRRPPNVEAPSFRQLPRSASNTREPRTNCPHTKQNQSKHTRVAARDWLTTPIT